ncbi:MAG TPA: pilin [Candidatus Saccharimonadales bacterium]|nr:pilin [Candidatus Saccharimonadales bacterium]
MVYAFRKKITALIAAVLLIAVPVAVPITVHAQADINNCLSQGTNFDVGSGTGCQPASTSGGTTRINNLITTVVNIFSALVGILAVIMIIYGGFQYLTSGGDTGKLTTARTTIVYAIVGIIIVAFAQFLVQFVLNRVVGTS